MELCCVSCRLLLVAGGYPTSLLGKVTLYLKLSFEFSGWLDLEQWLRSAGVAAVWCWSGCEEISHIQGQKSPSKKVGGAKSCLEANPIPIRDPQSAQTYLVHTGTQRPRRD